ncbi:MAG: hypothetical protein ACLU38_03810 [Dysosmobacter sp.]
MQDGARPLVTPALIDRTVEAAAKCWRGGPGGAGEGHHQDQWPRTAP